MMKKEEHARVIIEERVPIDNPAFAAHEAEMEKLKKENPKRYCDIRIAELNAELGLLTRRFFDVATKKYRFNFQRKMAIGNYLFTAPIYQSFWTSIKYVWQTKRINKRIEEYNKEHGWDIPLVK